MQEREGEANRKTNRRQMDWTRPHGSGEAGARRAVRGPPPPPNAASAGEASRLAVPARRRPQPRGPAFAQLSPEVSAVLRLRARPRTRPGEARVAGTASRTCECFWTCARTTCPVPGTPRQRLLPTAAPRPAPGLPPVSAGRTADRGPRDGRCLDILLLLLAWFPQCRGVSACSSLRENAGSWGRGVLPVLLTR